MSGTNKFIRSIVVAIVVMLLGYFGLNLPAGVVDEAVNEQLDKLTPQTFDKSDDEQVVGVMERAIDGDTIVVVIDGQRTTVRLIGINTPEVAGSPKGEECYGYEATERAKQLLNVNDVLVLYKDMTQAEYDIHNRLLAYVEMSDGRDFGEVMIREGYAREYTYDTVYSKQSLYDLAQKNAKSDNLGIWSECN